MEINITKSEIPTREELAALLENHFREAGYSIRLFGYGYGKSVIVSKSLFAGVRIFINEGKRKIIIRNSLGNPFLIAVPLLLIITTMFSVSKGIAQGVEEFLVTQFE
jgi:hypothetical protein